MTEKSLTSSRHIHRWIDEAFLWTTSSLTIMTIAAAIPSLGGAPASQRRAAVRGTVVRASLHVPRRTPPPAPPPLIAFGRPVVGYPVISPFGIRQLPWEEAGRLHKGVDIAAPKGTPVLAAADGVVVRTGVDAGYGRFVEVRHAAGLSTLYGHLEGFAAGVRPGAAVREGETVGPMGSTGSSTGSHVHFEVHDGQGRPLNPELFMGRSFRTVAELPLKQALRLPRGLRVAFVSFIPPRKRAELVAREDAAAEKAEVAERSEAEARAEAEAEAQAGAIAEARAQAPSLARSEAAIGALAVAAPAPAAVVTAPAPVQLAPSAPPGRVEARIDPGG